MKDEHCAIFNEVLPQPELPSLSDIYMLDAVVAKVVVSLDDTLSKVCRYGHCPYSFSALFIDKSLRL